MKNLLFTLFMFTRFLSFAQPGKLTTQQTKSIDSLNLIISTTTVDTIKMKAMAGLVTQFRTNNLIKADSIAKEIMTFSKKCDYKKAEVVALSTIAIAKYSLKKDYDGAIIDFQTAISISEKIGDKKKAATCTSNIGIVYWLKGELPKALEKYQEALKTQVEINDTVGAAGTYVNVGNVYLYQSDFPHALESYQKGERNYEKLKDLNGIAACVTNIGAIYSYLKLYDKAIANYQRGADLFFQQNKKGRAATSLSGVGLIYANKKDFEKALIYYRKALALQEEVKDDKGITYALIYIGDALMNLKRYDESRETLLRSLTISESIGDKMALIADLSHLGSVSTSLGEYKKAEEYLNKSLKLGTENGAKAELQSVYRFLSELYKQTNRPAPALDYFKKYIELRDSSVDQEHTSELTSNQMQYEFDKQKEISKIEQGKIDIEKENELKHQKLIRNSFVAGSFLLLILAFVIYKALRQKNKANIEISKQKEIIQEKNKDITDSINYAKRIQDAILPDKEIKYRIFPEAFILLQPRDIVSGDFYWFSEKNGKRLIAAADCTGHGVPGAFMSMIGNAFLNETVNEKGITEPGQILSELRHLVISSLRQTGAGGEQRDGMDISLLSFSSENIVEWAGANNPLWIIRNGELIEYKPDKRPISFYAGKGLPFTNHKIELQKGDTLYIFTDGYADQFGGPKGKKFKYAQLKAILLSIQNLPMLKQEETLVQKLKDWKGDMEQVDDICIIGLRV